MIKRNYYKVVRVFPDPSSYFYIKNETMSTGYINIEYGWKSTVNLEYSFDKVNWINVNSDNITNIYLPGDSYVYFRNSSGTYSTSNTIDKIRVEFNASIGGDVRTLFNYTDVDSVTAIPAYGLRRIITNYSADYNITDISNLSFRGITSIGDYGLYECFGMCQYNGTKGVDLRGITTLGNNALEQMYVNCYSLTEVYAPNVSTWDTSKSINWLNSVASTGVVYKPSTLDIPTDTDAGIPYNWTTQDYPTE